MKKLLGLVIVLTLCNLGYGHNFQEDFGKYFQDGNTTKQLEVLKKWESISPVDPELFTSYFNYYFSKSTEEILVLDEGEPPVGEEVLIYKDSLDKESGYIVSKIKYVNTDFQKGLEKINKGIELYPNRLDMRLGKIYVLGQVKDWPNFTSEIIKTVNYSTTNNNEWTWINNEIKEGRESFFLSSLQDYQMQLYNTKDGNFLQNMQDIANAVLEHYPNHIESLSNLSITYLWTNKYNMALGILLKAEKLNPKDFIILTNIAYAYKEMGEKEKAIAYYNKVLKHGDINTKKIAEEEIIKLKNTKIDENEKLKIQKDYNVSSNQLTAEDWFQKGYNSDEIGEYDNAILYYQKAIEINPDYAFAYINMGLAYGNKSNYDKAIECYQKAIEINPEYAEAYYKMGVAYVDKGNYDKAIECFQKAIEINPDDADAYYNMGIIYGWEKCSYVKAIEYFQKAIEIDPDDARAYKNMGLAYGNKSNYDKAIECFQKAIEINPDDADAYKNMGLAYGNKSNYDKAIECFQKAIEINPEYAEAYKNMGLAYVDKGNYNKAIECCKKAIEINPNYSSAYNNMGLAYGEKGNYNKAIECCKKAIEINPDDADAYYNMGVAYVDKGNNDKAIECYQKAIEINPDYADAYYNMGVAYVDKGNYDKAIECYQKAIEINPNHISAYNNLAIVYFIIEENDKGISSLKQAARLGHKDAQDLLGEMEISW